MRYKGKHDKKKEPWSRSDEIALAGLVIALMSFLKDLLN